MRRYVGGIALIGPISGKPDIGDAAPAGRGRTQPPKPPGGAGAPPVGTMTRREELADGRAFRPA